MERLTEEARANKNAYQREWRKNNKDKVKVSNNKYWEKKTKTRCYTKETNSDWCVYLCKEGDDEPLEKCKECNYCNQGYKALGED